MARPRRAGVRRARRHDLGVLRPGAEDPREPRAPGQHAGPPGRSGAPRAVDGAVPRAVPRERRAARGALLPGADAPGGERARCGRRPSPTRRWPWPTDGAGWATSAPTPSRSARSSATATASSPRPTQDFGEAEAGYLRTIGPDPLPHLAERRPARDDAARDGQPGRRRSGTSRRRPRRWLGGGGGATPTRRRSSGSAWPTFAWAASSAPSRCSRRPARSGPSAARRSYRVVPTLALAAGPRRARPGRLGPRAARRGALDRPGEPADRARSPRATCTSSGD